MYCYWELLWLLNGIQAFTIVSENPVLFADSAKKEVLVG